MGKNAHIHFVLETEMLEKLKREADEMKVSISELCRQKVRGNHQLSKIELMLERIEEKLNNSQ